MRFKSAAAVVALLLLGVATAQSQYQQDVITDWNRSVIDIHIVPPGHGPLSNEQTSPTKGNMQLHPWDNDYVRAMEDSVEGWRIAMAQFGEPWLAVELRTAVWGRDGAPTGADILIVPAEAHAGSLGFAGPGNRPCNISVALQRGASFSYADMFNIAGHEIGHCLGLAHVEGVAPQDIMQAVYSQDIGAAGNVIFCMSNLNVAGIQGAFAKHFGQDSSMWRASTSMAAQDYRRSDCQPTASDAPA